MNPFRTPAPERVGETQPLTEARVGGGTLKLVADRHTCTPPERRAFKIDGAAVRLMPGDTWTCDCGRVWVLSDTFFWHTEGKPTVMVVDG